MNILRKIREVDKALNQGLISYQEAADAVAPFTDAEPIKHGHWVEHPIPNSWTGQKYWTCSECNFGEENHNWVRSNYCPECGAKMDKVEVAE